MEHLRAGRLDAAQPLLLGVLASRPDDPDALHLLGLWHHERGDSEAAERSIRASVAAWPPGDPQVCVAWNNLGNVLVERRDAEGAVHAYRAAVVAQPAAPGPWCNLAALLRRLGQSDGAEAAARRAVETGPTDAHAWFTLSRLLIERGEVAEGLEANARGIALAPRDVVGREQVLQSLALLGRREEALQLWREWRRQRPDDPVAAHHEAACTGQAPSRASNAYVEAVFDGFAATFDAKLARLQYRAPELIVAALNGRADGGATWDAVADVGCGTGLAGSLLRERAVRLVGVDLSAAMLDQARRRRVYDELLRAELVAFLGSSTARFDVVTAVDVLCYFGALDHVAAAAAAALRPGGLLAFTVEGRDVGDDWSLALTGRYTHTPRYLADVLRTYTDVSIDPATLRTEAGRPVAGFVVVARKDEAA